MSITISPLGIIMIDVEKVRKALQDYGMCQEDIFWIWKELGLEKYEQVKQ